MEKEFDIEHAKLVSDICAAVQRCGYRAADVVGDRMDTWFYNTVANGRVPIRYRTFLYFTTMVAAWLRDDKDIVVYVVKCGSGAYVGKIDGICEDRLHRSATYERALTRAILNAIELSVEKSDCSGKPNS